MLPQTDTVSKCARPTKSAILDRCAAHYSSLWRDLDRLWEKNTVAFRLAVGVGNGQTDAGIWVIHANGNLVLAGGEIGRESELVRVCDILVLDPALCGHGALTRYAVLLGDDLAVLVQDVDENRIRLIDLTQGLPVEGEQQRLARPKRADRRTVSQKGDIIAYLQLNWLWNRRSSEDVGPPADFDLLQDERFGQLALPR